MAAARRTGHDRFAMHRKLGAGNFGEVWLATDTACEPPEQVAMKVVKLAGKRQRVIAYAEQELRLMKRYMYAAVRNAVRNPRQHSPRYRRRHYDFRHRRHRRHRRRHRGHRRRRRRHRRRRHHSHSHRPPPTAS